MGRAGDGNTQTGSEERESEPSMPLPDNSDSAEKSARTQLHQPALAKQMPDLPTVRTQLKEPPASREPREPRPQRAPPSVLRPAQRLHRFQPASHRQR